MATIPMGPGRRVDPARMPARQVSADEYGAPIGQALQRLGDTATNIGVDMLAQETRRQQQAKDSAERSQAFLAQGEGKLQVRTAAAEVAQRVLRGELDPDKATAEWATTRDSIIENRVGALPEDLRQSVRDYLKVHADEQSASLIGEAGRTRLRETTRANLLGGLEMLERDALRNRPGSLTQAQTLIEKFGPDAGMGPDDQFRALQGFKERTAFQVGEQALRVAGGDLKQLDAFAGRLGGDEFADLSPEARERLEVKAANRRAQVLHEREVQQRRAEALQERRLRDAEHATKALQGMIDGGALPDDATLTEVQRATRGTPYAGAIKTLVEQGAARASFGSLTPDQQQQALMRMRSEATAGTSPAALERLRTFENIASRTKTQVDADPLTWGLQSRLVNELAPLPVNDLGTLAKNLGTRVEQANLVGAHLRRPVSPLTASEAQQLGEGMANLSVDQRKSWVRTLAATLPPPQQRALAAQLNQGDGALALAMHAASLPKTGGHDVVDLILRGQDAVKGGRIKANDEATQVLRQRIAKRVNEIPWPTTKARDAATQATNLVLDGLRDQTGSANERKALELALGGELVEWNDSPVPAPAGWTESRFRTALRTMTPEGITKQARGALFINGQATTPEAVLRALPQARLMPTGPGRYAIDAGGLVTYDNRRAFELVLGD